MFRYNTRLAEDGYRAHCDVCGLETVGSFQADQVDRRVEQHGFTVSAGGDTLCSAHRDQLEMVVRVQQVSTRALADRFAHCSGIAITELGERVVHVRTSLFLAPIAQRDAWAKGIVRELSRALFRSKRNELVWLTWDGEYRGGQIVSLHFSLLPEIDACVAQCCIERTTREMVLARTGKTIESLVRDASVLFVRRTVAQFTASDMEKRRSLWPTSRSSVARLGRFDGARTFGYEIGTCGALGGDLAKMVCCAEALLKTDTWPVSAHDIDMPQRWFSAYMRAVRSGVRRAALRWLRAQAKTCLARFLAILRDREARLEAGQEEFDWRVEASEKAGLDLLAILEVLACRSRFDREIERRFQEATARHLRVLEVEYARHKTRAVAQTVLP